MVKALRISMDLSLLEAIEKIDHGRKEFFL